MRVNFRTISLLFACLLGSPLAQAFTCDVTNDSVIDRTDINLIAAARNTNATGINDVRDPDGDGRITVLDARICTLRCTRPLCSTANSAPVAQAGPDQTVAVSRTVALNGQASTDPDGDPLSFAWIMTSRPAGSAAVLSGANSISPSFVADVPGSYVVQLVVSDARLSSQPDSVIISTQNSAPVARAGANQSVQVTQTVQLSGAGSTDADGDALTYSWVLTTRPAGSIAALSSATSVNPSFVADKPGAYGAQLVVNDGRLNSVASVVSITTLNSPPVADAGADSSVLVAETVQLDGSASSDVDGNALTFVWSLTSRPAGSTATLSSPNLVSPSFVADKPGTYIAQLVVNDGSVLSAPDTVVIATRNSQPVANAGPNQSSPVGSLIALSGVASTDVDGDALTYRWSLLTRPAGSTATLSSASLVNPSFTLDQPGTYVAQLIVNDGSVDSAPVTVRITTSNSAPIAQAGPDQRLALNSAAQLNGGTSSDADGNPLSFAWALTTRPAGSTSTLSNAMIVNPSFVLDKAGTYVAQLIVNDGLVSSAPDTVVITTTNTTPVADAGPDQAVLAGATVQLTGAASQDADGNPLSYAWSFTSRPLGSSAALSAATIVNPGFIADVPGTYVIQLMVNDGSVDSTPDTVLVTATIVNTAPVAVNDRYTVAQGGSLTIAAPGVLSNDTDGQNNPLTAALLTNVSNGTLTLNPNGGFIYTPNAGFSGSDSFVYRANDGALNSASATVNITVTPTNRAPVANAGTNQNVTVGSGVQLNGATSSDPDGDPLTYAWTMSARPAGSSATLSGPTLINPTFVADVAGTYTLQLIVNDGRVNSSTSSVTVTAAAAAPVLISISITPANSQVGVGLTRQFTATGTYQSGATQDLTTSATWASSSTAATVSATGLARGIAAGTSSISASLSGVSGSTPLTVNALNAAPAVSLSTPAADSRLTEAVQVIGSVTDTDLVRYTLEYALQGSTQFVEFASGVSAITNGVLGSFDPTQLTNGIYTVRLVGEDALGQRTATSLEYVVDGDVKIGNFTITYTDLNIALPGLPITVNRTYDSRVKQNGDFGIGWKLDVKTVNIQTNRAPGRGGWRLVSTGGLIKTWRLQSSQAHYVTISFSDGRSEIFDFVSNESWQVAPPTFWQAPVLTPRAGVTSTLVTPGVGNVYVQGDDLFDDGFFATYNPQDYRLTTADGTVYDFTLSEGLKQLRDANGNTITINASGIIHSAGVSVPFVRGSQNRITQITDPNGNSLSYSYDTRGNLATFTDALTNVTSFSYANNNNLTEIRDPLGRLPLRNEYDTTGRLIANIDASGNRIEYTHVPGSRQEIVRDRNGNQTVYEYDTQGNVIGVTNSVGERTTYSYDARGNKLSETNPLGQVQSFTYDSNNNVLSETRVVNGLTTTTGRTYNALGKPLTITDALGRRTTNTYDAAGNLLTSTDAAGNVTRETYDARGSLLSSTDGAGNITRYTYDVQGRQVAKIDASGATSYTYDANGNKLSETDARGGVTRYTYDAANRLTTLQDALGNIRRTEYDAAGNKTADVDALGNRTVYAYDVQNRLIQTTLPDGSSTQNGYDAEGNRISATDAQGRVTQYFYDSKKQLIRVTYPDGAVEQFGYDALGRQTAVTDALGNTTSKSYDEAGQLTQEIDPLGHTTSFTYDAVGNLLTRTDANGRVTQYAYDNLNRLIRTTLPGGEVTTQSYDALGRKTAETDAAGNITRFSYDALGRLTAVTDAAAGVTRYEYDANGNRTAIVDARGNRTSFAYDAANRLSTKTLPNGALEAYTYDAGGRQLTKRDPMGRTIAYGYDNRNRLLSKAYPDGSRTIFTYTATGKRATAADSRGITGYTYDARDRLSALAYPDGQAINYAYDQRGGLLNLSSIGGTIAYLYDNGGRLRQVTDPANRITTYTYDAAGNRAGFTLPTGATTSYTYDVNNRLTNLVHRNGGAQILASYAYTLGPIGNRTRINESSGLTRQYRYDSRLRLTGETVTDPAGAQTAQNDYSYDAVGNRQTRIHTGAGLPNGTTNYTYNPVDQLLTENGTSYAYDLNGNLITQTGAAGTASYSYDFENRLIQVVNSSGTTRYQYDADGNRVERTDGSGTTRYLVDTNRALPQVLAEYTPAGSVIVSYVYGDDLISQIRNGQTYFYHADGQGSTRLLTDSAGSVTDTYNFDAFGNLITRTGTTANDFLYTGQQSDANSGFYYLRARYYQPGNGRFTALDTFEGDPYAPITLHKYLYGDADPVNNVDPSGHMSLGSVGASISISINLGLTAVSNYTRYIIAARLVNVVIGGGSTLAALGPRATQTLQGAGQAGIRALQSGVSSMAHRLGTVTQAQAANSLHLGNNYRDALNRLLGLTQNPAGIQYHHLVERSTIARFGSQAVNSIANIAPTPASVHQAITALHSRVVPQLGGPLRTHLQRFSFEELYKFETQLWAYAMRNNSVRITYEEIAHLLMLP